MLPSFLLVAVAVITFVLSGIVIAQKTRDNAAWAFAFTMAAVSVWSAGIAIFLTFHTPSVISVAAQVYYIAATLIPLGILYLSFAMTSASREPLRLWWSHVFLLLPTILIIGLFVIIPELFFEQIIASESGNIIKLNPAGYIAFMAYFVLYYGAALATMVQGIAHSRGVRRARLRYLLVGYSIGGAVGMTFNLILPILGNYRDIWVGPLGLFIFVPIIYITITRFGLFDIRLAVVRTAAYLLSLSTLAAIYIALAFAISQIFLTDSTAIQPLSVILALALAFVFQPIKKFFDRWTNRLFYKDNYSADAFFAELTQSLTHTTDLRHMLERSAVTIANTLKSQQAFFIVNTEEGHFITAGTDAHAKVPAKDAQSFEEIDLVVTARLQKATPLHRLLVSHRLGLVMALRKNNQTIGYLCLGEHHVSGYTNRDIRALTTVSDELIIAIQNALSLHEVKNLNATLQQRIDAATKELRASNAQLQRLDEVKNEFISMASHQLRTPLTSVKGYISMVIEGDAGNVNDQQKHLLNEAFISSERMVRLIGDFLNVSRLQTGKFIIERQPADMVEIVRQEIDSLLPNATARGLKFVVKLPKKLPLLMIDENKMRQVVMNFADNAMYYTPQPNSKIEVSLKKDGDFIVYKVKDQGIGVPVSQRKHLFEKFFRAENARRQRPDGTGIGLYLAKRVVDAHKGQIIFESQEGKGSTFGFALPIKSLEVKKPE